MILSSVKEFLGRNRDNVPLSMNRRNLELVFPRNPRQYFPVANDKRLSKQVLGDNRVPVAPTLAVFSSFRDVAALDEKLAGLNAFVIKPARGSGGRGILVITGRDGAGFRTASGRYISRDVLVRHIGDIVFGVYAHDKPDVAIVEARLIPDPFFASLYADGLSDVRLILADDRLALCMLRVPTRGSDGRANLHQGAIGIGVDADTGTTFRAWQHKRVITTHPENGAELIGITVPSWRRIVRIAKRAARTLPLKFLGVDMVVDAEQGPLVLEVNARPGIEIQNVNGISLLERFRAQGVLP